MRHLLFLCFLSATWALNPLHEATYQLHPQPFKKFRSEFGVGALTHFESDFNLPIYGIFGINNSFELGARINMDSRGEKFSFEKAHVQGDVGVNVHLRNGDLLQADVLFGIGDSGGEGLNVTYTRWHGLAKKLNAALTWKWAFFDGLVGDQVTVTEFGFHPSYQLNKDFQILTVLTYSTAFPSLKEWSAFDLAPGLRYFAGDSRISFLTYFGVAGQHSEGDMLFKFGWSHDF